MQQEPFHVLVVEDDPDDVYFLQHAFESAAPGAVRLSVVEDGEAAVRFLQASEDPSPQTDPLPHLILLDVNLPKGSGLDLLEALRCDDALRHMPIIVLSASTVGMDVERAYRLGANGYLSKDVDLEHLDRVAESIVAYLEIANEPLAEDPRAASPSSNGARPREGHRAD